MSRQPEHSGYLDHARVAALGRRLCLAGALIGLLGLAGWATDVAWLTTLLPDQPPMMPNTAVALALAGLAGAFDLLGTRRQLWRALPQLAALLVIAIGVATLVEYGFDIDLGIDQLLFQTDVEPFPGRPSPLTAWALSCLGGAIILSNLRSAARARPFEWLALSSALAGFAALAGQLLGAGLLYRFAETSVIGVAVPTAISLLLTSTGVLLERPAVGILRQALSPGPGGVLLRRLTPVVVLAPLALGFVVTQLNIEGVPLAVALVGVMMTVVSLMVLSAASLPIDRTHEALESSRAQARDLIEHAADAIFLADLDGRYTDVNGAGCRMLGYSTDEIVGRTITDLLHPDDVERLQPSKEQLLAGRVEIGEWRLRRKDGSFLPVEVSARILQDGRWQGIVRDISARKRAEEQLRQSQERVELALRGADLAIWDWNITTGEVVFNHRWGEMRGFHPDAIRPHVDSWRERIHPDDWPHVEQTLTNYFQGRLPEYETEHRSLTKQGDWIWVLERGKVFARDDQGRPTRMAGTELDITARKRAEDALRLSEKKFSRIISMSADAIVSIDAEQRITMFNAGAERIFGYSQAEIMGAPLDILIPERFRAAHRRHVEAFAAGADGARRMGERGVEILARRKSGEVFPADAAISKLELEDTRILTVALRDITEQKRVEREQSFLAEAGSVFAASLEYEETLTSLARLAVQDLAELCIIDIVDEDGEVRRLRVVCRDESKSWVCRELMRHSLRSTQPPSMRAVLETRKPLLVEKLTAREVASWAEDEGDQPTLHEVDPGSLIIVPLIVRGRLLGAMALVASRASRPYDQNDLRLSEELATRAALSIENARLYRAAQRATQARDDVMGMVAHDLRNPLGVILMQAPRLRRQEPDRRPQSRDPAEVITRAATRMNRLIQDLLDVAQMEAGRLTIAPASVLPEQIVRDSVDAQQALAAAASLELRADVPPGVPAVWADRDRLLQVFENLITNAIKFTRPGGRITVGAALTDRTVLFRVADTGVGISADDVPRVFDRFWQANKGGRHGAGLGLPIVHGIVEAHGGRIWVDSQPGHGSTFFFTIPVAAEVEQWGKAVPQVA